MFFLRSRSETLYSTAKSLAIRMTRKQLNLKHFTGAYKALNETRDEVAAKNYELEMYPSDGFRKARTFAESFASLARCDFKSSSRICCQDRARCLKLNINYIIGLFELGFYYFNIFVCSTLWA